MDSGSSRLNSLSKLFTFLRRFGADTRGCTGPLVAARRWRRLVSDSRRVVLGARLVGTGQLGARRGRGAGILVRTPEGGRIVRGLGGHDGVQAFFCVE